MNPATCIELSLNLSVRALFLKTVFYILKRSIKSHALSVTSVWLHHGAHFIMHNFQLVLKNSCSLCTIQFMLSIDLRMWKCVTKSIGFFNFNGTIMHAHSDFCKSTRLEFQLCVLDSSCMVVSMQVHDTLMYFNVVHLWFHFKFYSNLTQVFKASSFDS